MIDVPRGGRASTNGAVFHQRIRCRFRPTKLTNRALRRPPAPPAQHRPKRPPSARTGLRWCNETRLRLWLADRFRSDAGPISSATIRDISARRTRIDFAISRRSARAQTGGPNGGSTHAAGAAFCVHCLPGRFRRLTATLRDAPVLVAGHHRSIVSSSQRDLRANADCASRAVLRNDGICPETPQTTAKSRLGGQNSRQSGGVNGSAAKSAPLQDRSAATLANSTSARPCWRW